MEKEKGNFRMVFTTHFFTGHLFGLSVIHLQNKSLQCKKINLLQHLLTG